MPRLASALLAGLVLPLLLAALLRPVHHRRPARTGRLYVVTKAITGGIVYAAPAHLSARHANRLQRVGTVPGLVTDGAFMPDGRHVLLRTYWSATLVTFPGFRPLGTVTLPRQRQGEGLAVSRQGHVYLSSEGRSTPLLEVALPKALAHRADTPAADRLGPTPSPPPAAMLRHRPQPAGRGGLLWISLSALAAAVAVWLLVTVAPPRSRRRQ